MGHRIGVIAGDGIGREVVAEGLKAIDAAGVELDLADFDLGGTRYLRDGTVLDDATLDDLRDLDAIYLGAVGTPDVPSGVLERGLLLRLRFELDLYVNLRPFAAEDSDVDFVVVRENTEGPYVGEGGVLRKGTPHEVATQGSVNTRFGVERCARFAFDLATDRRKKLTLLHKTNVLTFAGDLWRRTVDQVNADYPDVAVDYQHIDAACIHMVSAAAAYDVIVTDNLFGDIITDLAAAMTGGIGRAASANLNPARTGPSLFEPVHGSAPDIAGMGRADPTAAVLSAAMMVDFLGEADAAARIRRAVGEADAAGELVGTTTQVGDAIVARLRRN
jgi:3-isopropylmalate dehydrogenase